MSFYFLNFSGYKKIWILNSNFLLLPLWSLCSQLMCLSVLGQGLIPDSRNLNFWNFQQCAFKNFQKFWKNKKYLIYAEVTHVLYSMWSCLALPSAQVTHVLYVDCLAFLSVRVAHSFRRFLFTPTNNSLGY